MADLLACIPTNFQNSSRLSLNPSLAGSMLTRGTLTTVTLLEELSPSSAQDATLLPILQPF